MDQTTVKEGCKHTGDWIGTLAIDGSLEGIPGRLSASGYGVHSVAFDHDGERKYGQYGTESLKRRGVFALRNALANNVLSLKMLPDNLV